MARCLAIHSDDPQPRLISQAITIVQQGGVIVYPTECCYALGCQLNAKAALERIVRLLQRNAKWPLTLMCSNLSQLSHYAQLNNQEFRLLKSVDDGLYTFILAATKAVPARLVQPKQKTIGMRIAKAAIAQALVNELGEPLVCSTLWLPSETEPLTDPYDISIRLNHEIDLVIDGGWCGTEPTTVIDLVEGTTLLRQGKGDAALFGC